MVVDPPSQTFLGPVVRRPCGVGDAPICLSGAWTQHKVAVLARLPVCGVAVGADQTVRGRRPSSTEGRLGAPQDVPTGTVDAAHPGKGTRLPWETDHIDVEDAGGGGGCFPVAGEADGVRVLMQQMSAARVAVLADQGAARVIVAGSRRARGERRQCRPLRWSCSAGARQSTGTYAS